MRTDNGAFRAYLQTRNVRLARLWTIVRVDGTALRFTDHDENVTIGGQTFDARIGFTSSSIMRAKGSRAQGLTITTYMQGGASPIGLSEQDIRAGNYDGAVAYLDLCAWDQPGLGSINLWTGKVGQIEISNEGALTIDVDQPTAGATIKLDRYSANCRASFGDDKCKFPIDPLKIAFTVTDVALDRQTFTAPETVRPDPVLDPDYWKYGTLVFDSGLNKGFAVEVMASTVDGVITLFLPTPFALAIGDTGRVWPGCDKQFTSGCVRWNNRLNFRGEPGYQAISPPVPVDNPGSTTPGDPAGSFQPWFVPRRDLPGHGFFWGEQRYDWIGAGAPVGAMPATGLCNSLGGAGFLACLGPPSVNLGQSPYSNPGGVPDRLK